MTIVKIKPNDYKKSFRSHCIPYLINITKYLHLLVLSCLFLPSAGFADLTPPTGGSSTTTGPWTFEDYAIIDKELDPIGLGNDARGLSILDGASNEIISFCYYPTIDVLGGISASGAVFSAPEGGRVAFLFKDSNGDIPIQITINEDEGSSQFGFYNTALIGSNRFRVANQSDDIIYTSYLDDTNGFYIYYGSNDESRSPGFLFGAQDGTNASSHGLSENDVIVAKDFEVKGTTYTNGDLNGTGEVYFAGDTHGNSSSCSATELLIDGPGIHCDAGVCAVDAIDADIDVLEACGGEGGIIVMGGDAEPVAICESSGSTDVADMFDVFGGEDAGDVRACVLDLGGVYATVLLPVVDTFPVDCASFAVDQGLPPPLYEDSDYFTLDPETCTWSYTPDAGLSAAPGWTSPPTVSSSGEPSKFAWEITDSGDITSETIRADTIFAGNSYTSYTGGATVAAWDGVTSPSSDGVYFGISNLKSIRSRTGSDFTGFVAGTISYSNTSGSTDNFTNNTNGGVLGGYWQAEHIGSGTVSLLKGSEFRITTYGADAGTVTKGVCVYPAITQEGAATSAFTNADSIWIEEQAGAEGEVTNERVGIRIDDLSIGGTNYGIKIAAFTNSGGNDYGIYTNMRSLFGDDVELIFGKDGDASVVYDETTDDELKVLFGAAERINMNSTGIAFNGAAPVARPDYTTSNCIADREFDANATTTEELADVLCTLIADLEAYGLVQ